MNLLSFTVVLGLLVGTWAQPIVRRPLCDSPEAEEAALVAQDYLNAQHHHGYKYVLNQIDDIKVYAKVSQQVEVLFSYIQKCVNTVEKNNVYWEEKKDKQ